LALAAGLVVMNMTRRAQAAATQGVSQVYVVTATQDVPEYTAIPASSVAVKAFPAAFAPPGSVSSVDQVVGKYSTTRLVREQIVLGSQVSATRSSSNPSAAIPAGKVAFWMPVPDLLAQSGGLQPGDHVDILLTVTLTGAASQGKGMTTQNTVQNAEVFFVGPAVTDQPAQAQQPNQSAASKPGAKVMAVLVDPQDAVIAKFIKDSGATIDLVLRSRDWQDRVTTEAVTADALVDRFQFRVPDRWSVSK
jgi:pilus assembly protein CpaB